MEGLAGRGDIVPKYVKKFTYKIDHYGFDVLLSVIRITYHK